MVGEHPGGFPCGEIPQSDGGVEGGGDDLWVGGLADYARDGLLVA